MTGNMTIFKFGKNHVRVLVFVGCMMMTKCFLLSCGPVSEIFRVFRLGHHITLFNTFSAMITKGINIIFFLLAAYYFIPVPIDDANKDNLRFITSTLLSSVAEDLGTGVQILLK